jgi:DNA-directed RNA polymerase subunit beta
VHYLDASEEARFVIAQANAPVDQKSGKLVAPVLVRKKGGGGEPDQVEPEDVDFMDVSPA